MSVPSRVFVRSLMIAATVVLSSCGTSSKMNFFVTSRSAGHGGDLGGLNGADALCAQLAVAAGSAKRDWRAYLSAPADSGRSPVNARDRVGAGPWFNAKGVQIAATVDDLHSAGNLISSATALDETGAAIFVGKHDILTGSNGDGTLAPGDATCRAWTSTSGRAMVGHNNRAGNIGGDQASSWNSAHLSDGCTLAAFEKLGGAGLLYCFAVD